MRIGGKLWCFLIVIKLRRKDILLFFVVVYDLFGFLWVVILIFKFDLSIKLKLIFFSKLKLNCYSFIDLYFFLFYGFLIFLFWIRKNLDYL